MIYVNPRVLRDASVMAHGGGEAMKAAQVPWHLSATWRRSEGLADHETSPTRILTVVGQVLMCLPLTTLSPFPLALCIPDT